MKVKLKIEQFRIVTHIIDFVYYYSITQYRLFTKDRISGDEKNIMDKEHKTKRISLMDMLKQKTLPDDEPVITKGKLRKIKEKFDDPKTLVNEGKDGWGDDMEVNI